jgi:hypothetical protein
MLRKLKDFIIDQHLLEENKIILFPNMGLGDQIMYNSRVNLYSDVFKYVILCTHPKNLDMTKKMYSHKDNVIVYPLSHEKYWLNDKRGLDESKFKDLCTFINDLGCSFEFARDINTYELRYNDIYVYRDLKKEQMMYDEIVAEVGPKYIVVNDDELRQIYLDDMKKSDYPEVHINLGTKSNRVGIERIKSLSNYIFDWVEVLKNAYEIHTFNSSFANIIDRLNIKAENGNYMYTDASNRVWEDQSHKKESFILI